MSLCCPCSVLSLPLSLHKVPLMSLPWPFFCRRLLVGLWKVYKKATFDPHRVHCLSIEMVDLNVCHQSFIRPSVKILRTRKRHWAVSSKSSIFLSFSQVIMMTSVISVFVFERHFWENHAIHMYTNSLLPHCWWTLACEIQVAMRVVPQLGDKSKNQKILNS